MFAIEFAENAAKQLEKIHKSDRKLYSRMISSIEALREEPFLGKQLKGQFLGDYSLRVGDYRVIYTVYRNKLIIYIIDLGHRREIYR